MGQFLCRFEGQFLCRLTSAGGGAAGCMAAVEAAKKVLLVQAGAMLGGSSAISSGWICATNTVWHEKRGIKAWTSQQRCTQAFGSAFIS
ncbi:FAD-binding protein [Duodenibacillus massiliensis]|uniref:FAD-binding protein n=1 Tax=Duodenibacillus massiliensis TaxID=1852381 RepID=UPI003A91AE27